MGYIRKIFTQKLDVSISYLAEPDLSQTMISPIIKKSTTRMGGGFLGGDNRTRFAFLPHWGKNKGSHQCLHWWQELSAGQFQCYGFESVVLHLKRKTRPTGRVSFGGDNRTRTCDLMRVKHAL